MKYTDAVWLKKEDLGHENGDNKGKSRDDTCKACWMKQTLKDPLLTMTLCAPNEKQDKGNLGQKGLSDNTKVDFGATKNHG